MRNFHLISRGLPVVPLCNALARQPDLWNQNTLRTMHPGSPHTQVDDIWLRFNSLKEYEALKDQPEAQREAAFALLDEHESVNYPAFARLPQARGMIFDLMRVVEGERLGRVLITRMRPGARIAPHEDGGSHAAYYERYHIALQVLPGVVFRAGDEQAPMMTGDCWWFDNSKTHEVVNNSADDRLTLIVDIRVAKP